jgi:hypothetical protein
MNWIEKNLRKVIYIAFLIPILLVALVSISHVTKWYGISNPTSWSIYLSVAVEIAALSTLAAIAARMGRKVYFPFAIVTLIQFIGNVFFAYQFIDIASQSFKDWVDLVSPLVQYLGIENGDMVGHKRFLAFFAGGMLPIISLSFLHMLVKFEEEEKKKVLEEPIVEIEEPKLNATPEDLEKLEVVLSQINEDKFGVQVEESTPEPIVEEPVEESIEEPIEEEKPGPVKKVLSYLRRDA